MRPIGQNAGTDSEVFWNFTFFAEVLICPISIKRCPSCGSTHARKHGTRNGVQLYKCSLCKRQFRAGGDVPAETLWEEYLTGKQTVSALARRYGTSESTVKRRLATIADVWELPEINGGGYVHLDATYGGRNCGILAGVEDATGHVLYLAFIAHE